MRDHYGREIDYMRISLTDRCNLRCRYCMPDGIALLGHQEILRYEELLRVCRRAAALGIRKFKVTGGEPLVRKGCPAFIGSLKEIPGVEQVTLTTNGVLLEEQLDALVNAGVDGINISLDTLDDERYCRLTGGPSGTAARVLQGVEVCVRRGIPTKLNAVLLPETLEGAVALATLAERLAVDVRFIERMPMGGTAGAAVVSGEAVLALLRVRWPDLCPTEERRGNGPAAYYKSDGLLGRIGLITAMSHIFCAQCNRIRLTSTGGLKPCLCFPDGPELRPVLRGGGTDDDLDAILADGIRQKPLAHRFDEAGATRGGMYEIGG